MSDRAAIHHGTLESFFFEEIERAQARCGQSLSDEAGAYVVGLLARFARAPRWPAGAASRWRSTIFAPRRAVRDSPGEHCGAWATGRSTSAGSRRQACTAAPSTCGTYGASARRRTARWPIASRGAARSRCWARLAETFEGVSEVIAEIVDLEGADHAHAHDLRGSTSAGGGTGIEGSAEVARLG